MDALDAIMTRRSIRRFTDEAVGAEEVRTLLQAAAAAPSAGNQQAWEFVIVDEKEKLLAIHDFHEYAGCLREAPLAIAVCGNHTHETIDGFWAQDCAAATQNLLLASHALGYGAVWLGIHPIARREDGMRQLLRLPREVTPFSVVAIGRPAETKEPANRYDPGRVHRNGW